MAYVLFGAARERKIAHAIAEKYNILHQSSGTGSSRALLLAKDAARTAAASIRSEVRQDIRRAAVEADWTPSSVPRITSRIQERPIAKYLGVDVKRFSRARLGEILIECANMSSAVSLSFACRACILKLGIVKFSLTR